MRIKLTLAGVAAALICAGIPAAALASHHPKPKPKPPYYLALGDSLSVGVQPNAQGKSVPMPHGYAARLYAAEKGAFKNLKFMAMGCPGESTTTMMNGGICKYGKFKSQLAAAVAFLKTHNVKFLTIDIGANDVDNCVSKTGTIDFTCVGNGSKSIQTNLPKIAKALRQAAPKVRMVGMTYYDPFLALYLKGGSDEGIASASVSLAKGINTDISNAYTGQSFKVADVATTFKTYVPFTDGCETKGTCQTGTYKGHKEPIAVAEICNLTWMCAPAPKGPNIHANDSGYRLIETVFKPLV